MQAAAQTDQYYTQILDFAFAKWCRVSGIRSQLGEPYYRADRSTGASIPDLTSDSNHTLKRTGKLK